MTKYTSILLFIIITLKVFSQQEPCEIKNNAFKSGEKLSYAPSGTALLLGQQAADGRGVDLEESSVRVRDGYTGAREDGSIGFATMRGGSVVGEHSVILAGQGERIELSHIASDRSIFALGAVKAALWAKDQPHGLYTMLDVLGLK